MVAVGTRISPRPPHIYGPAARCKRINWMGHAVRFNLSGLWLEHALRAIMEIRAQLSLIRSKASRAMCGARFQLRRGDHCSIVLTSLPNLGREAPDLLLARSDSRHAAFGVRGIVSASIIEYRP